MRIWSRSSSAYSAIARSSSWFNNSLFSSCLLRFYSNPPKKTKKNTLISLRKSAETANEKFIEKINKEHQLFKPGQIVVDLGCAPGIWSTIAARHVGLFGRVIACDIIPCRLPENSSMIQGNILSMEIQLEIAKAAIRSRNSFFRNQQDHNSASIPYLQSVFEEERDTKEKAKIEDLSADVIMSDLGPPFPMVQGFEFWISKLPYLAMQTNEHLAVKDELDSLYLAQAALLFAIKALKPDGIFLCKVLESSHLRSFAEDLSMCFKCVKKIQFKTKIKDELYAVYFCSGKQLSCHSKLLNI